jgi:hypothetical protein
MLRPPRYFCHMALLQSHLSVEVSFGPLSFYYFDDPFSSKVLALSIDVSDSHPVFMSRGVTNIPSHPVEALIFHHASP